MRYSIEQRIFTFQQISFAYVIFQNNWLLRFPGIRVPSQRCRKRLLKRFSTSGSVADLKRSGRPRSARTEENIYNTAIFFVERFHEKEADLRIDKPTSEGAAKYLGISPSSVQRILKRDVGWSVKMPRKVQLLSKKDIDARITYYNTMLRILNANPSFLDLVIWTDEAIFKLDGQVRTNLLSYWGDGSNRKVYPKSRNHESVMVSVGLWRYGVIGPFFFEDLPKLPPTNKQRRGKKASKCKDKDSVDSHKYLQLLQNSYMPEIEGQIPMSDPEVSKDVCFQLDGASIHTAKIVKDYLDEVFPLRWIGNGGDIHWPPNSPDLTPLGLFSDL